jgi:hypothetical protein
MWEDTNVSKGPLSFRHSLHPEDGSSVALRKLVSYHITIRCYDPEDLDLIAKLHIEDGYNMTL